jgi:hypothetical protein
LLCGEVRYDKILNPNTANRQWQKLTKYQGIKNKFSARGIVRGGSLALCAINVVGCGLAYTFGKREKEEKKV